MARIVIPSVGIAMEEALLVKWLKQPGDAVAANEPLAEIETDKANMEVTSPVSGKLGPHLVEPGAIIPVGNVIVEVLTQGEDSSPEILEAAAPGAGSERTGTQEARLSSVPQEGSRLPSSLSPRARRLAREREVERPPQAERFRALIAAKVVDSWREIPHFTVTREVNAEPMLATLVLLRKDAPEPMPTMTDLLLRALAIGLREWGYQGPGDVGLAVDTDYGVVIPVVHDVLGLDAVALTRVRRAAVQRARSGRLSADDLGATPPSTLSNLGAYGVDQFTGVIALGQTSLLTVGRAAPRVVAEDTRTLQVRTSFFATLNADHRVIDGAGAARLLGAFSAAAEAMTSTF